MQNSNPSSQQQQQAPPQKYEWNIVSLKDPVLNQALHTQLEPSQRTIHLEGDRFRFDIFNGFSAMTYTLPGGRTEAVLEQTLQYVVDKTLSRLEKYISDTIGNNLNEFLQGKLNSKSAVLRGKNGEELTITPVGAQAPAAPTPPQKQVWLIYSVKDPVLDEVLRTKFSESERRIQIENGKLSFTIVNSCWSGLVEPLPGIDPNTYTLYQTLEASADSRQNQLERYVSDVVENNLKDFLEGKFDSKSVILRGEDEQVMTIAPVTISISQIKK